MNILSSFNHPYVILNLNSFVVVACKIAVNDLFMTDSLNGLFTTVKEYSGVNNDLNHLSHKAIIQIQNPWNMLHDSRGHFAHGDFASFFKLSPILHSLSLYNSSCVEKGSRMGFEQ